MHERDVLSLHMLPFVAEEACGKHVAMRRDEDVDWESLLLQKGQKSIRAAASCRMPWLLRRVLH